MYKTSTDPLLFKGFFKGFYFCRKYDQSLFTMEEAYLIFFLLIRPKRRPLRKFISEKAYKKLFCYNFAKGLKFSGNWSKAFEWRLIIWIFFLTDTLKELYSKKGLSKEFFSAKSPKNILFSWKTSQNLLCNGKPLTGYPIVLWDIISSYILMIPLREHFILYDTTGDLESKITLLRTSSS